MRCVLPGLVVLLLLASAAAPAIGQEPIVRITASPEEVPVGDPLELEVTVLVPTWFLKPPVYPAVELTNTITRVPPDSSYPTNERIGRDTWAGIVRTYQVYPLVGATYRLSGQTMTVTYNDPEKFKPVTVKVDVPEVEFRARVPAGAETLNPYLAGRRLTLDREIEGEVESLEAGDALVVRYTAELDGMPVIFLPTLVQMTDTPGVSIYPDQPVVEETEPARRTETYTFVFEAGGDFIIPGTRIDWWNKEAGRIETSPVEPMTVSVAGDPLPVQAEEAPPPEPVDWRRVLIVLLLLYIAWKLLSRLLPKLQAALAAWRKRRLASEEYAFAQLEKALAGKDRRNAQAALLTWLERIAPGHSLASFAARYGDEKLESELNDMSRTLYRDSNDQIQMKRLLIPLTKARRNVKHEQQQRAEHALPPLNP